MSKSTVVWAVAFIGIGFVLLLFTGGVVSGAPIGRWIGKLWPLIFVVIGLLLFFFRGREKKIEEVKK